MTEEKLQRFLGQCARDFEKKTAAATTGKRGAINTLLKPSAQTAEYHLRKSQLTPDEIQACVRNCELDENVMKIVNLLLESLQDKDVFTSLENADQSAISQLTKLDQVAYKLVKIPHIITHITWMTKIPTFETMCSDLEEFSDQPALAIKELMTNTRWLNLLKIILFIGNSMNYQPQKQTSVYGFDLSSINKLFNTNSMSRFDGYTLMHFLAETIDEDFPELKFLWEDFPALLNCKHQGVEVVDRRQRCMEARTFLTPMAEFLATKVTKQLPENIFEKLDVLTSAIDSAPKGEFRDHQFIPKITPFVRKLTNAVKRTMQNLQKADDAYQSAKKYFCIQPPEYKTDQFISDMATFMINLEGAHKRVEIEREKVRQKEQQKQRLHRAMTIARDKQPTVGGEAEFIGRTKRRATFAVDPRAARAAQLPQVFEEIPKDLRSETKRPKKTVRFADKAPEQGTGAHRPLLQARAEERIAPVATGHLQPPVAHHKKLSRTGVQKKGPSDIETQYLGPPPRQTVLRPTPATPERLMVVPKPPFGEASVKGTVEAIQGSPPRMQPTEPARHRPVQMDPHRLELRLAEKTPRRVGTVKQRANFFEKVWKK